MGISNVTETQKVSAPPAPPVASAPKAEAPTAATPSQEKEAAAPVDTPAPPPPPPPPVKGYDIEVLVGEHGGTGHRVYGFVEPDSGELLVQIPNENVLNLVAKILAKLEAEGRA